MFKNTNNNKKSRNKFPSYYYMKKNVSQKIKHNENGHNVIQLFTHQEKKVIFFSEDNFLQINFHIVNVVWYFYIIFHQTFEQMNK